MVSFTFVYLCVVQTHLHRDGNNEQLFCTEGGISDPNRMT